MARKILLTAIGIMFIFAAVYYSTRNAIDPKVATRVGTTRSSEIFKDTNLRALADAAGHGDVREIDRLVDSGVDVNATGAHGTSPLLWALLTHNHDGFLRLLDRGADPNAQHRESDIGAGSSVTSVAAGYPTDSFYLEQVMEHGGNPNLVDSARRWTPIFKAIENRSSANLKLLIRTGADLNFKEKWLGSTPAMVASDLYLYEGVYLLLEAGADFRLRNKRGQDLVQHVAADHMEPVNENRVWKNKVLDFFEAHHVDDELKPVDRN